MSVSSLSDFPKCSICLEELRKRPNPKMLSCGHVFHSICIDYRLVDQQENFQRQNCPECRESVAGFSGDIMAIERIARAVGELKKIQEQCDEYHKISPRVLTRDEKEMKQRVAETKGVSSVFVPTGLNFNGAVRGVLRNPSKAMRERAGRASLYHMNSMEVPELKRIREVAYCVGCIVVAGMVTLLFDLSMRRIRF